MAVPSGILSTTTAVRGVAKLSSRVRATGLSFRSALLALVALALLVRVVVVVATPHFVTIDDSATYDRMAVSIARHGTLPSSQIPPTGGPEAYPPPLFSVAIALPYRLVGVSSAHARWEAGRILEALLGAITVALIGLLAARLFGRRVALLSAAIAAVYPPLVLIGSSLMSESLFVPLVLGAVLAALAHRDTRRLRFAILSGVLVALAALTHSNGIVLLPGILLLVWGRRRPRWSWPALRGPTAVLAATIATLTPWTVRNAIEFHEFVPITTETGFALAGTYNSAAQHNHYPTLWTAPIAYIDQLLQKNPRLNEAGISDGLERLSFDYIRAHPSYVLTVAYWSAVRLLNLSGPGFEKWEAQWEGYPPTLAYLSVYAFWLLLALALAGITSREVRSVPWAVWACPLLILLSALPFAGLTRYRSPVDPFLIMVAAVTLLTWWRRLSAPRAARTRGR